MYRCAIFDLDGTLLNTLPALQRTTNLVLEHFGLGPVSTEQIKQFVGDGYKNQMRRALLACGDEKLTHYDEALEVYQREFAKNCNYEVKPYDGICDLLEALKQRHLKLAVLSNKPHERTVENIETVFGKGYMDMIAGEQEGVPKKPDPAGVYRILEKLEVTPEECLYFGDTNTDMRTGLAAGLTTVGVLWGFRDEEELKSFKPHYLIASPDEILNKNIWE